jgi:hypothetical protein
MNSTKTPFDAMAEEQKKEHVKSILAMYPENHIERIKTEKLFSINPAPIE